MRKLPALLAMTLIVMMATANAADARGGRTTVADCKASSTDPDCPDEPDPPPPKPKLPGQFGLANQQLERRDQGDVTLVCILCLHVKSV